MRISAELWDGIIEATYEELRRLNRKAKQHDLPDRFDIRLHDVCRRGREFVLLETRHIGAGKRIVRRFVGLDPVRWKLWDVRVGVWLSGDDGKQWFVRLKPEPAEWKKLEGKSAKRIVEGLELADYEKALQRRWIIRERPAIFNAIVRDKISLVNFDSMVRAIGW